MLKFLTTLCLVASLVFMSTGCDKRRKATEATARLAAQVHALQVSVEESYDRGLINRDTALSLTRTIRTKLNPGVKAYTEFIANLNRTIPKDEKPTRSQWQTATAYFDVVQAGVRDVLVLVGVLNETQSTLIQIAIDALLDLITIIKSAFASVIYTGGREQWQMETA